MGNRSSSYEGKGTNGSPGANYVTIPSVEGTTTRERMET